MAGAALSAYRDPPTISSERLINAKLESVTRSPIVTGAPLKTVMLQARQFEGLEWKRVMKKSE